MGKSRRDIMSWKDVETFKEALIYFIFKRTKELLFFLVIILVAFMLMQNLSFGMKDGKFWFQWDKAAEIKINK